MTHECGARCPYEGHIASWDELGSGDLVCFFGGHIDAQDAPGAISKAYMVLDVKRPDARDAPGLQLAWVEFMTVVGPTRLLLYPYEVKMLLPFNVCKDV